MPRALVDTRWLDDRLGAPNLRILDASWHMPSSGRDAHAEYRAQRIPGAGFFDIDAISDKASLYPHTVPSVEAFEEAASALGIANENTVVVYDAAGLFSAARAWWMFRLFGHDAVYVLDGGLPKWLAEDRAMDQGEPEELAPARFTANFKPERLARTDDILKSIEKDAATVVDMRSPARFVGAEKDPRAGVRSGHIPDSKNIHYQSLVKGPCSEVIDKDSLLSLLNAEGVPTGGSIIASCGSGVTACILALALHEHGLTDARVYDGSWAEWGSRAELPIA